MKFFKGSGYTSPRNIDLITAVVAAQPRDKSRKLID